MARVAIIGGSGFIGTQTCRELVSHEHHVTVMDLVKPCEPVEGVEYIITDATKYNQIYDMLSRDKFDYVYMFAAISDSNENVRDPLRSIDKNIVSLVNVLQCVTKLNIPRIIFSSTVWVYSVSNQIEVNEDTDLPINRCDHIYTTAKLTCEALIRNYNTMCGVNYTILRYGIAYGPGCHPDTVLSKFMHNAIQNKPLVITGGGDISRNFLNVKDHARGNRMAMSPNAVNQTINLEGPEKITIQMVADRVAELHGDIDIVHIDERVGDYKGKIVSNNKSYRLLNWRPAIDFKHGTKRMYEHITA